MKHFVVKVLVVVAIGLFALPRLQAQQDTTITIYGKRFAPGVEVYLDGQRIYNVVPDSARPSRILRVKIPFSILLQAPATVAGVKNGGASLTSTTITHILRVINPGPNQHGIDSTITVIKAPPTVVLKTTKGEIIGSDALSDLFISALVNGDTLARVSLEYKNASPGSVLQFQIQKSNSPFSVLDSNQQIISSLTLPNQQGKFTLFVRFQGQSQLGITRDTLNVKLSNFLAQFRFPLEGLSIRKIKILVAFTDNCSLSYSIPRSKSYGNTTLLSPVQYIQNSIEILNNTVENDAYFQTKLRFTRFILAEQPFRVNYQEGSVIGKSLFTDIDSLPTLSEITTRINSDPTIRIVLLLVNNEEALSRAILSQCSPGLPERLFIVAEIKYSKTFIGERVVKEAFYEQLKTYINNTP
jgi:hypothetical protein